MTDYETYEAEVSVVFVVTIWPRGSEPFDVMVDGPESVSVSSVDVLTVIARVAESDGKSPFRPAGSRRVSSEYRFASGGWSGYRIKKIEKFLDETPVEDSYGEPLIGRPYPRQR